MADYGKTTIGGTSESLAADTKRACKFTSPSDIGDVDSITVYANRTGTGAGYAIRGGIYTDSSGSPNALVANSDIEINSNIARNSPAWYSISYGTKPSLSPSTPYWLCVQAAKASLTYYDTGASNQQATRADTYSDGLADPFGASPTFAAREMSIYVSYTAGTTYFQTLPATAIGVAGLTTKSTYKRTLAATAVGSAVLATKLVFKQALAATAVGVATLSTKLIYAVSMAATAIGVATLSTIESFKRTLAATAIGVAGITRVVTYKRTLAAVATGVTVLTTKATFKRTLAATAVGAATLATARTVKQTLAAVAVGVATLATEVSEYTGAAVSYFGRFGKFIDKIAGLRKL